MATMTKQQMVQAALDDGKTTPNEGTAFIQSRFGVVMTRKHFSSTKNVLTSKAASGAAKPQRGRPSRATPVPDATAGDTPVPEAAEAHAGHTANGKPARLATPAPSPADLARQLKRLVADHGADAVADMLAVFAE